MEDVLSVYERRPDPRRPVICMDETSKELRSEVRAPEPLRPGQSRREDVEYERHGSASIFLFTNPHTGWCHVEARERRTRVDWAQATQTALTELDAEADAVELIMDNLNTHSTGSFYEAFPPEEAQRLAARVQIHHTPVHGSWLNIAEILLSVLSRQCLQQRIPDLATLQRELAAWEARHNAALRPVRWQFTTADARTKLARLYPTILV